VNCYIFVLVSKSSAVSIFLCEWFA
jgi:hypothetical protein